MAKRFMFVCIGILALGLAYHVGAENVSAQAPNAMGGPASATASPQEVVVLTGVANDGQTIPLPTYADGTTALESECHWIVSVNHMMPVLGPGEPNVLHCSAEGRLIQVHWCGYHDCSTGVVTGSANYMIIATRGSPSSTPAQSRTWGHLKTTYR